MSEIKSEVLELAKKHGWIKLIMNDVYMTSFKKDTDDGTMRMNVWTNDRNNYLTVGTHLNHPKAGRNQLFRKFVTIKELADLFKNPRTHTGKGYREK